MIKIKIIIFGILFLLLSYFIYCGQPYVLLVSMDGFRWDYLNRNITPSINKFADSNVKALSLMPVFPSKTFPNHYSIITGLYAENHGIISNSFLNPFDGSKYSLSDKIAVTNSYWYKGEAFWETAKRNGIITASYFWPGSEVDLEYRKPDYFVKYQHDTRFEDRVKGVINWLTLPYEKRPHFLTLYFHEPDAISHSKGVFSNETNEMLRRMDTIFAYLLFELKQINMLDSVDIILISDHGMEDVSDDRTIDIKDLLGDQNCIYDNQITFVMIYEKGNNIDDLYQFLKQREDHFTVYKKNEIPDYLNYSRHPFISSILLIADPGWIFVEKDKQDKYKYSLKATHGWDNYWINMHGIFIAGGPSFKENYVVGTLQNIDIYPLLCKIFNIQPAGNIDGKLERIGFVLKHYNN